MSEDGISVAKVFWLITVWSLGILPRDVYYKKAEAIHNLSSNWETLRFCRGRITRVTRWRLCSWLFSLVWCVLPRKLQLSQNPQRYPNSADVREGLGSVSVTERDSLGYMDDKLVYVQHTYCDTHIYMSITQRPVFLLVVFFFSSYLSVCKRKKANMLSFRELWTVMVFNGVVLAISRNSKFFLLEYESLLHFTVIIALLLLHYSAR